MFVISLHWNPKEVCSNTREGIPQQQIDEFAIKSEDRQRKSKVSFCPFIRRGQPRMRVHLPLSIIGSGKSLERVPSSLCFAWFPVQSGWRPSLAMLEGDIDVLRYRTMLKLREGHFSKNIMSLRGKPRLGWALWDDSGVRRVRRLCSAGPGSTGRSQVCLGLFGLHIAGSTSSDSAYLGHA